MAKLKEVMVDLGDSEEKRLSGLRIEKDDLTKELHDTRYLLQGQEASDVILSITDRTL